jgi:cytosine/adenosine deaminase-related metal-dependent hydrolase
VHRNPGVGFGECASALVRGNPEIARRQFGLPLGALVEGGPADLIVVDYRPPTPLDETTLLGHLFFGLSQAPVDTTIVDGRILMRGRKLTIDLDEEEVAARARELAAALWKRF